MSKCNKRSWLTCAQARLSYAISTNSSCVGIVMLFYINLVICMLKIKLKLYFVIHTRIRHCIFSGFGHQVNSDTHLQTVEIQMRRLLVSRLIRIFTVCLVNLFFIPIIEV